MRACTVGGSNISSFLPLVSRTLSTMRWGYKVVFSLTESWLRKPHAQARIHNPDICETVEWYRPQLPDAHGRTGEARRSAPWW